MTFTELLDLAKQKQLLTDEDRFRQVYDFAVGFHNQQLRYTGDPSIDHPLQTSAILASWGLPQVVLEAGLLHETLTDGNNDPTLALIKQKFGTEVAFLIESAHKVGQVKLRNSTQTNFVENMRKMFVALAQDIRVVLLRLADRLHNAQTLEGVPLSKQQRIAIETLEIYAPLAERLGMGQLKGTLEDLVFPYAFPDAHDYIMQVAAPHFKRAQLLTHRAIKELKKALALNHLSAQVHGRHKHKFSLYKKLLRPEIDKDITKVHDLVALRVITQSQVDCYAALGLVHNLWKPVPHIGISDFIAQPKPNGYRSIHTKVFDHSGRIMEVQIRTERMHQEAEYGAAAHYAYSDAKTKGVADDRLEGGTGFKISDKMAWIKQLANWQQQVTSSSDFVSGVKLDALSSRIYVFSPKGDVFDLPAAATPVDFAFEVHSDLGFYIQAAKVNGRIAPLDHPLQSGDLVEILKSKNKRTLNRDWLRFVKTSKARSKIHQALEH